jgi:hypothetical protein
MRLAARTACSLAIVANAIVFLPTAAIAVKYVRRHGLELTYVLALLPPPAAIAAVLLVGRTPPRGIGRGAAIGLASAATLYVSLSAIYIFGQYGLLSRDGTAFWALVIIPAAWVWPPVLLVGAALGAVAQALALRVRRRGRCVQPGRWRQS